MRFSFERVNATDYDELRPTYATEAIRWVADRARLEPGSLVVDLAAGTGQLSRRFSAIGVRVVAVEPAANMRAILAANLPDVTAFAGSAEAIPLGDGAADAVVVGNAFHHFDAEAAFAEIRRVLGAGGALALFWARTDRHADGLRLGIREIDELVERERASSPVVQAYYSWFEPPERIEGFAALERRSFATTRTIASARLADLYATSSDIASLPEPQRVRLLERIGELSADLPETLELAERSDVQLWFREGSGG
ncbi:MAG TPA: class I SAM-dependent methyltransferase [Actinomycetota bacterium]|nr:class I SAM-dependent methyltransferase [Actinomycetota bacterium]